MVSNSTGTLLQVTRGYCCLVLIPIRIGGFLVEQHRSHTRTKYNANVAQVPAVLHGRPYPFLRTRRRRLIFLQTCAESADIARRQFPDLIRSDALGIEPAFRAPLGKHRCPVFGVRGDGLIVHVASLRRDDDQGRAFPARRLLGEERLLGRFARTRPRNVRSGSALAFVLQVRGKVAKPGAALFLPVIGSAHWGAHHSHRPTTRTGTTGTRSAGARATRATACTADPAKETTGTACKRAGARCATSCSRCSADTAHSAGSCRTGSAKETAGSCAKGTCATSCFGTNRKGTSGAHSGQEPRAGPIGRSSTHVTVDTRVPFSTGIIRIGGSARNVDRWGRVGSRHCWSIDTRVWQARLRHFDPRRIRRRWSRHSWTTWLTARAANIRPLTSTGAPGNTRTTWSARNARNARTIQTTGDAGTIRKTAWRRDRASPISSVGALDAIRVSGLVHTSATWTIILRTALATAAASGLLRQWQLLYDASQPVRKLMNRLAHLAYGCLRRFFALSRNFRFELFQGPVGLTHDGALVFNCAPLVHSVVKPGRKETGEAPQEALRPVLPLCISTHRHTARHRTRAGNFHERFIVGLGRLLQTLLVQPQPS